MSVLNDNTDDERQTKMPAPLRTYSPLDQYSLSAQEYSEIVRLPELIVENEVDYDDIGVTIKKFYSQYHISDATCQFCFCLMMQPVLLKCGHRLCKDCLPKIPRGFDFRQCPTCGHPLVRVQSPWENHLFNSFSLDFNRTIDRNFQEIIYNAFPEQWNMRGKELQNAIHDFKLYQNQKDGFIKFVFKVQLMMLGSPNKYKNMSYSWVWQIKMESEECQALLPFIIQACRVKIGSDKFDAEPKFQNPQEPLQLLYKTIGFTGNSRLQILFREGLQIKPQIIRQTALTNQMLDFEQMIPMRRLIKLIESYQQKDLLGGGQLSHDAGQQETDIMSQNSMKLPHISPSKYICYQFLQRNEASLLPRFEKKIQAIQQGSNHRQLKARSKSVALSAFGGVAAQTEEPEQPPADGLTPKECTTLVKQVRHIVCEFSLLCMDCLRNPQTVTFNQCRHRCICFDCVKKYKKHKRCPFCEQTSTRLVYNLDQVCGV